MAISFGHLLNDVMQSMLPAIYPLLSANYSLSLLQIALITATYQITGSILQPLIGIYTDKRPLPYSLPFASAFTMAGLLLLANNAHHYYVLLGRGNLRRSWFIHLPSRSFTRCTPFFRRAIWLCTIGLSGRRQYRFGTGATFCRSFHQPTAVHWLIRRCRLYRNPCFERCQPLVCRQS